MSRKLQARLDDQATEALDLLTHSGRNESEAVRYALIETAARDRANELAALARDLASDPADRAEVAAVREVMESLRPGEL